MDVFVPEQLEFVVSTSDQHWAPRWLCFMHAVQRAARGEDVKVHMVGIQPIRCDDCADNSVTPA